jgi:hypothetical protein
MACVSLDLLNLVLQRIGQHPIGALYGVDVDGFGGEALDPLLERQILVQQPMLEELDGCPVQWIGTRPFLFDLNAECPPEEVDPRLLSTYEIHVLALCRALRRANQLAGPPVEQLSDLTYYIGHRGNGRQRRSVCLARLLRDDTVSDVVWALRARIGTGTLVLLTPGVVELRHRTLEHLAANHAFLLPLLEGLDREAPHPFALRAAVLARAKSAAGSDARLQIDAVGGRATLDGREVPLGRQEFAVLLALAEEARDKNGYVGRSDLLVVIEAHRNNPADPATPENLDNALSRLRRALADAAGIPASEMTALVETKRGVGHRLGLRKLGLEPNDIAIF